MNASPEWETLVRTLLAFVLVVGLIYLSAFVARKYGIDKRMGAGRGQGRLQIVETLYLDPKRRLVIARCDDKEHVLLLSPAGDVVVASKEAVHAP